MDTDNEIRLALGDRADKLGLILSQIGDSYRLTSQEAGEGTAPVFEAPELDDIDKYLARIES